MKKRKIIREIDNRKFKQVGEEEKLKDIEVSDEDLEEEVEDSEEDFPQQENFSTFMQAQEFTAPTLTSQEQSSINQKQVQQGLENFEQQDESLEQTLENVPGSQVEETPDYDEIVYNEPAYAGGYDAGYTADEGTREVVADREGNLMLGGLRQQEQDDFQRINMSQWRQNAPMEGQTSEVKENYVSRVETKKEKNKLPFEQ